MHGKTGVFACYFHKIEAPVEQTGRWNVLQMGRVRFALACMGGQLVSTIAYLTKYIRAAKSNSNVCHELCALLGPNSQVLSVP